MKISGFLLPVLCFYQSLAFGQDSYEAGTSSVSLEPDSTVFSLSLAGFGYPREGRFSITWKELDSSGKLSAVVPHKASWYGVNASGNLVKGNSGQSTDSWKQISHAENTTALVVVKNRIYAIRDGAIWFSKLRDKKIKWKKLDDTRVFTALAGLDDKLYAATSAGDLLESSVGGNATSWDRIGPAEQIISMTAYGNKLYALNNKDSVWSAIPRKENFKWMQIGRMNGITVTHNLKHIAVAGNTLYGLGPNGRWYKAAHNTTGSLSARSVAIKKDGKTVVLVGLDLTGINASFSNEVKEVIRQRRGIPEAAILINASHTHFAPVTQAWSTWGEFYHEPDSNYLNNIVKKAVILSIEQALDNLEPANISFGRGSTDIGSNRRQHVSKHKPNDKVLDVLKFEEVSGEAKAILFLTGCHPVFKNAGKEGYTLDANYPGVAKTLVEEKSGTSTAIFIQGCGGDINPVSDNHLKTGEDLSKDVMQVLQKSLTPLDGDISFSLDKILIPVKPWSRDSIINFRAIHAAGKPGDVEAEKNVRWSDMMLKHYENNTLETSLPLYIQTINIGDWKLVGMSREVVNDYAPAIRALWPGKKVSVAGYCNDVASYLPAAWHVRERHYEGLSSFSWYGQHGIPSEDVLDFVIEKIKSFNR